MHSETPGSQEIESAGTPPDIAHLTVLLASPRPSASRLREALAGLDRAAVPALLSALAWHRVDGLAHNALASLGGDIAIDGWLRSSLRRRHERCAAATLARGLALAEILEALAGTRLPVIVLRGLRSVEAIYGDAGVRPSEDIDLLVRPEDRGRAAAVLARLGYASWPRGPHRRGGVLVDLHDEPWGCARRPSRGRLFPFDVAGLFDRARPGRVAGAPALLPEPEDELHLLAVHAVKHSFDRLIRTADLAHLVAAAGGALRWGLFLSRARASRTATVASCALEAAVALGVSVPDEARPARNGLAAALVARAAVLRPVPYTGEILMALAAPTWTSGGAFLLDAIVPAGDVRPGPWTRAAAAPGRIVSLARGAAAQRWRTR